MGNRCGSGLGLAVAGLLMLACAATAQLEFHVSPTGSDEADGHRREPFLSLKRAQQAVRDCAGRQPVTIFLHDGTHRLEQPLVFTPADSGTLDAPVVYKALPGARPVVDGGRGIGGWKPAGNGVWTAQLPDPKTVPRDFVQLYVNGNLRRRARIPNEGFLRVAGFPDGGREVHYHTDCQRFEYAPGDIDPAWRNLSDVEVIVYHYWTDSHLPIREVDAESRIVTFKHKAGKVFTDDFLDEGARYLVENVYEGLDAPGEWYLDRESGVLHYIPFPDEDMKTAEVVVPVVPNWAEFRGRPMQRDYVEHVRFEGIGFRHTRWRLPKGNSNDRQGSSSVPAAIRFKGARHCAFTACSVEKTGTWAFEIGNGCSGIALTHNTLAWLGGGGVRIGGGDERSHPLERTGNNIVSDNHLHHYGETYPSAVGLLVTHSSGNRIAHNHIHHGFYTGISIGWEWGYQRSVARDNLVEFNHIHDIGQGLLSDMGAVYTLGVSPGTVIRNNLIHNIDANHYGGWGIYNDEGSSHILVENNVVFDTKFSAYNVHYAKEITVRNNIFAHSRMNLLSRGRMEPHTSFYFENNICFWDEGELLKGNWADKPYAFHFSAKDPAGGREASSTFEMDYNLYFNPETAADEISFSKWSLGEWRARGKDVHSLIADPLFVSAEKRDYRLRPESPAFDLGFQPINLEEVGIRLFRGAAPVLGE
ncbi:hypothetical protein PDESU_03950 [Pontiella desulfatans]|uniref:Right handed beta helix domain-containing protein n=1 Tax=Pontiella desulfatans TaxID=2750659 RepID=A0A6C2U6D4_PONDE|nr:right-handed parallel beta-helix repeat-containing protein [Pontiella desulfatans]VGO15367.1 hypothetical protein PDESU_03950 [Pontiella desulfatans]